jgi:hypothetical protein
MKNLFILAILAVFLAGCSTVGKIKSKTLTVLGVESAGKGATLDENHETAVLPLPAGTRAVMTSFPATAGVPATETSPAIAPQPGRTVTEFVFDKPTEWRKTGTYIRADTGTVDTTVARHRIDVAERRWLLWVAIGCGIAGLVMRSTLPQWPSISNGLLLGAVAAGLAWKLAEVPAWLWLGILALVTILVLGYKRREKDEKEEAIELAKDKAIAVVVPPAPPPVVIPVQQPTPTP